MLLTFTFELWPAKLLRLLAGFILISSDSARSSSGGGGGSGSSSEGRAFSSLGGGGRSGEGILVLLLAAAAAVVNFGGLSGTHSSSEMILPIIIAPRKSDDKCWRCSGIWSRIDEYSDADDVLQKNKKAKCIKTNLQPLVNKRAWYFEL